MWRSLSRSRTLGVFTVFTSVCQVIIYLEATLPKVQSVSNKVKRQWSKRKTKKDIHYLKHLIERKCMHFFVCVCIVLKTMKKLKHFIEFHLSISVYVKSGTRKRQHWCKVCIYLSEIPSVGFCFICPHKTMKIAFITGCLHVMCCAVIQDLYIFVCLSSEWQGLVLESRWKGQVHTVFVDWCWCTLWWFPCPYMVSFPVQTLKF